MALALMANSGKQALQLVLDGPSDERRQRDTELGGSSFCPGMKLVG